MSASPSEPSGNVFRGILFMAASGLSNSIMAGLVRGMSSDLHPFELAFFRCLFGFLAFAPLFFAKGWEPLRTQRLGLHVLRGSLNVVTMLSYFFALSLVPLAKIAAIDFSGPLFAVVLAVILLGEAIRIRRMAALLIGFTGGLVILRPGIIPMEIGVLSAFLSAFVWGTILIIIKRLTKTETSVTATLYMALVATPLTGLASLPYWQTPTGEELIWLVLMGIAGTTTHLCTAQALREADATAVLPANFMRLVWAAGIGYLAFGEVPDIWTWVGGVLIFGSVCYIAFRERKLGMAPTPVPTPTTQA
jgi:drug/metabolite transporter (DMT)-like permease